MATNVQKIDSNSVGLSYAEEESIGVLPGSPVWRGLDPNGYNDFGGQIKTVARRPINPSRQQKKGVTTDFDASGGFNIDLTQKNIQDLMQGFFFADFRRKAEEEGITDVRGSTDDDYVVAVGTDFIAGDLIFASGFDLEDNNGLKVVDSGGDATHVPVTTDLTAASTQDGKIVVVGHQFASGDLSVDTTTYDFPALVSAAYDVTDLGLNPGEFIFVGGDDAGEKFATAADNGWARVREVIEADKAILFDKTSATWVADNGSSKTIRLFFGRVLKNETGDAIIRRSYHLERTLGVPDTDQPTEIQTEVLKGQVPNEFNMNVASADKITVDMTFVGTDVEQRDGGDGPLSDNFEVEEADAFNTSSDMSRAKLSVVGQATPLFAFFTDLKISIKNNVTANKAVGVTGSFDLTAGIFEVSGSFTAYFADNVAAAAVRDNADITMDFIIAKANAGIAFDMPLVSLGDARPKVEIDQPIQLPITLAGATGAKIDPALNHSMMVVFYDYLPNAAQ